MQNSSKKSNIAIRVDENGDVENAPIIPWNSMPKKSDSKENEQTLHKMGGTRVRISLF